MKMFILKNCPYCKRAIRSIKELKEEYPCFKQIEIELIDEQVEHELANQYDYYYVPSLYDNKNKLHEGAITKDELKNIFDEYLQGLS